MKSYCTNQREAELRTCAKCRQDYYCTRPESLPVPWVCAGCKGKP
jgi:hypothetical protein